MGQMRLSLWAMPGWLAARLAQGAGLPEWCRWPDGHSVLRPGRQRLKAARAAMRWLLGRALRSARLGALRGQ